jgi:hypothetical protein
MSLAICEFYSVPNNGTYNAAISQNVTTPNSIVVSNGVDSSVAGQNLVYLLRPKRSGTLAGLVASGIYLNIYDASGNVLVNNFTNTTRTAITTVTFGTTYYVVMHCTSPVLAGLVLFQLNLQITPIVTDFFNGGFITVQPFIQGITAVYDAFGQITFNFNNVQLQQGQQTGLYLGYSGISVQSGTISITSSDNSVFRTITGDNFPVGVSLRFQFEALRSTTFTGTITITVNTVGTLANVNTLPVPYSSSSTYSNYGEDEYKRKVPKMPYVHNIINMNDIKHVEATPAVHVAALESIIEDEKLED